MGIKFKSTPRGLGEFIIKAKAKCRASAYRQYLRADVLKNSGCYRQSIKYYLSSILMDRDNYRAYLGLGIAYRAEEKYEKAIDSLLKARTISYFTSNIHFELGLCYLYAGFPCAAIDSLKTAIMLDRNNINAQLQLAVAHELIGEFDMAILIYHTIIENDPSYLTAYNHLAAAYMNFEEYKAAGSVFSQVLKINPIYYKAILGLAICYDKMSLKSRAAHYYKLYLDKKPHSHHSAMIQKRIEKLKNVKEKSEINLKLAFSN